MPIKHTIQSSITANGQKINGDAKEYEAALAVRVDETIDAETADVEIAMQLDVDELVSIFILSNKDLLIETNNASSGSADDIINIKAGVPYIWNSDSYDACLITTDVTSLFVTNAEDADARLRIEALVDPTP